MARVDPALAKVRMVWVKMNKWQLVGRKEVRFVMNLEWFRKQGLLFMHDFSLARSPEKFGR